MIDNTFKSAAEISKCDDVCHVLRTIIIIIHNLSLLTEEEVIFPPAGSIMQNY